MSRAPTGTRVGHDGRRADCPYCGYNLIATIDANRYATVCPECGERVEFHEVIRGPRRGEWNAGAGLGRAAGVLAVRGAIAFVAWVVLLLGLSEILRAIAGPGSGWLGGLAVIGALVAVLWAGGYVGERLVRRLDEHAGFDGLVLALLAAGTAAAVLLVGVMVAEAIRPLALAGGAAGGLATFVAAAWCVRRTLLDDV